MPLLFLIVKTNREPVAAVAAVVVPVRVDRAEVAEVRVAAAVLLPRPNKEQSRR